MRHGLTDALHSCMSTILSLYWPREGPQQFQDILLLALSPESPQHALCFGWLWVFFANWHSSYDAINQLGWWWNQDASTVISILSSTCRFPHPKFCTCWLSPRAQNGACSSKWLVPTITAALLVWFYSFWNIEKKSFLFFIATHCLNLVSTYIINRLSLAGLLWATLWFP